MPRDAAPKPSRRPKPRIRKSSPLLTGTVRAETRDAVRAYAVRACAGNVSAAMDALLAAGLAAVEGSTRAA